MGDVNIDSNLNDTDVKWLQYYVNNKKDPEKRFNHVCADMNFDGNIDKDDVDILKAKIKTY